MTVPSSRDLRSSTSDSEIECHYVLRYVLRMGLVGTNHSAVPCACGVAASCFSMRGWHSHALHNLALLMKTWAVDDGP